MRFLSDEWLAAMDRLLATSAPLADPLVLQQVVAGERDYYLQLGPGTVTVAVGRHPHPTVTFTQSRATAWAVFAGDISAEEAFVRGDIDLSGDVTALLAHGPVLAELAGHLVPLRDQTEGPARA
jgi:hypothetical protein